MPMPQGGRRAPRGTARPRDPSHPAPPRAGRPPHEAAADRTPGYPPKPPDQRPKEVTLVPTDETGPALDPTPRDPAEEARGRRLLAEVRHVGPLPDDVAHRLDAALVRLVEERAA